MLKKLLSVCLTLTFVLTIGSVCCANGASTDYEWELEKGRATAILTEYEDIIKEIESTYGITITKINDKTMRYIVRMRFESDNETAKAVHNLSQAISCALAEQNVLESQIMVLSNYERIEDLKIEILVADKMLSGQVRTSAAVGVTQSKTYTYSIGFNGSINVNGYGSLSFNVSALTSEQYALTGPAEGTKLYNNMTADVRYAVGILYGDITRTTWKLVDSRTGKVLSTHETITIPQSSRYIQDTTCNAAYGSGNKLYINSGKSNVRKTGTWSSYSAFETTVSKNPANYLNGIGDLG